MTKKLVKSSGTQKRIAKLVHHYTREVLRRVSVFAEVADDADRLRLLASVAEMLARDY